MAGGAGLPRFVGREKELSHLRELLERARAGRGGTAVIGGDAGMGKSRLCRELKAVAAAEQMRVIEGRCSPAESSVPYGPFIDALRFRLARGERNAAADVLQPILAHVAPLFEGLADTNQARRADPTDTPFDRIFGVLHRLASHGPVLFIVEDLHWADPTSRDLIHFVAHRIAALPMVLLLTYRTDEIPAGDPVHRLMKSVARADDSVHVQLGPLAAPEVSELLAQLLGRAPDADFVAAVLARTDGNPLFIEELVSKLGPDFAAADVAAVSAPATVEDLVQERLAPLDTGAREALLVAAVIGREFSFDLLANVLAWPEERLLPAMEQLVAHQFLVEQPGTDERFAFRHALVQEVIYQSAIGRRRRVWHRRVAAVLAHESTPATLPHATLAHHYQLGGAAAQARAHLILSGDEAARLCAWKEAEAKYEQALSISEQQAAEPEVQATILERLAEVAWWQHRLSAVEEYAREALLICHELHDHARAARLLRRLANLDAHQRGDFRKATARLRDALALVEDQPSEAAVILNDLGRLLLAQHQWSDAQAAFGRALAAADARGDCAEEALALVNLGRMTLNEGHVHAGVQQLELARALLAEEEMPLERAAEVYHVGIRVLDGAREHTRAQQWVSAGLQFAERHHLRGDRAIYQAYAASIQRRAGDWERALAQCAQAVAELRAIGRAELREALRIYGDLLRVRGELSAARAAYDESVSLGETHATIGLALLYMAEENWEPAAAILERQLASGPPESCLFAMRVLPILVEVRAGQGMAEAAAAALERLEELTSRSDYRAGGAATVFARAVVLAAAGQPEGALPQARAAHEQWNDLELPYEAARAALLLARIGGCAEHARQAADTFRELQARFDLCQAESLLRRLGAPARARRAPPALPAPLDRLTGREVEVLREVARGRTNKQIAKLLGMSPKTAGNHVTAILGKLGCATRTEAAQLSAAVLGRHPSAA